MCGIIFGAMLKKLLFYLIYVFAVFSADVCDLWQENHHAEVYFYQEAMLEQETEPEIELINHCHGKPGLYPYLSFSSRVFVPKMSPSVHEIFKPPEHF